MRILLVEDEEQIRKIIKLNLEMENHEVIATDNGRKALELAESQHFDLMILDVMLPEVDGFQICSQVRLRNTKVGIIIVSAKDTSLDRITGLKMGADDYLTKPFGVPELLARLRASVRRFKSETEPAEPIFRVRNLELDRAAHIVKVLGPEVHLTSTEYDLLSVLVKHAGKVVTHRMLLNEVWGPNSVEHVQYLRVYRGKLGKN